MLPWRPIAVLAAVLATGVFPTGCKRGRAKDDAEPPAEATDLHDGSELVVEADLLVDAFASRQLGEIHQRMTPDLRERVRLGDLEFAAMHLADRFGPPQGIMEEKVHKEGELTWYSGLVVHALPPDMNAEEGSRERRGMLTPVLYQFALTPDRRMTRLLVREHWFWSAVEPPADYYVPVNRFHVPGRGDWYVSHGGRSRATNKHNGSRGQRFAYDLVVKKNGRSRPARSPKRNESFFCYGEPVLAPASGVVVHKVDGVKDNQPGVRGEAGGNGIRIDHGFGEWSSLWHMVPGSVRVEVGDRVEAGQVVGLVGNSGRSTGPHIHLGVFNGRREFGLPAEFVDSWVDGRWRDRVMPVRGEQVRSWPDEGERTARGPLVFVAG